jgi:hypothetical protein
MCCPAGGAPAAAPSSAPAPAAPAPAPAAASAGPSKSWPPHTVAGMPALSPTMTQGNIVQWKKKVRSRGSARAPQDSSPRTAAARGPAFFSLAPHAAFVTARTQVGDSIAAGDILVEVETDKATIVSGAVY